jgi:hypothetical protein
MKTLSKIFCKLNVNLRRYFNFIYLIIDFILFFFICESKNIISLRKFY